MKKLLAFIITIVFVLSLTACGEAMDDTTSNAESMGESVASDLQSGTSSIVSDVESTTKNTESTNFMAGITAKQARDAALKHAGLTEEQVSDVDVDLDRDNGKLIYEVDFNVGNTEYDYDIDAENGEVISTNKSKD